MSWDQVIRAASRVDISARSIRRGITSLHRRMRSHEFAIWRNEWNEKHGINGSLELPEILIDLNQRQQLYAVARGILASIKESLASGRGMGDRKTVAQATQEHRRRMMSAPTRPRTDAFEKRYQGEPSKGGSAWGYDSGLLVEGLKLRKLRGRKKKVFTDGRDCVPRYRLRDLTARNPLHRRGDTVQQTRTLNRINAARRRSCVANDHR